MAEIQEEWRKIEGFDKYEVSNLGRTRNAKKVILKAFLNSDGYLKISLYRNNEMTPGRIHCLVAKSFIPNPENKPWVDHIDGNPLNNIVSNLRWATISENSANSKKHTNNTSGFKGVSWSKQKNKWRTLIHFQNKQIHIGYYKTAEEAHEAYKKKATELFGEFARYE